MSVDNKMFNKNPSSVVVHIENKNEDILASAIVKKILAQQREEREERETTLDSFIGAESKYGEVYDKQTIEADKREVADLEAKFAAERSVDGAAKKERADAVEGVLNHVMELNNWLGQDIMIAQTTKFDDIKKGVDLVAYMSGDENGFALGIDLTTSDSPDAPNAKKKVGNATHKIKKFSDIHVKYYESDDGSHRGAREVLPVVVGVSVDNIKDILALFGRQEKVKQIPDAKLRETGAKKLREEMENHPLQIIVLKEIEAQLMNYVGILSAKPAKTQTLEKTKAALAKIREVIASKSHIKVPANIENDAVYAAVKKESKVRGE